MFRHSSSRLILALRIALIAFAAGAVAIAIAISRAGHADSSRAGAAYACPMHPNVTSAEPGDCSICKMELEPVHAAVHTAAETQQAAHTHGESHSAGRASGEWEAVGPLAMYTCPMHPEVISATPGKCAACKTKLQLIHTGSHAGTAPETAKPSDKYVCPMHPKVTAPKPGSCPVCKMDLVPEKPKAAPSAPGAGSGTEMAKPSQKYVCPMHPKVTSPKPGSCHVCKMDLVPEKPGVAAPATGAESETSSFTVGPNAEMRHYEAVVRAKSFALSKEMRLPAWMQDCETGVALLYLDELELLEPKEEGFFSPLKPRRGDPPQGIKLELSNERPTKWDRSTVLVKFRVPPEAGLVPLQTGSVKFEGRLRRGLVVQASAVLQSPEGPYTLVVTDGRRTLTKRPIETGSTVHGYATVISGLRRGEEVAATHTLFLDAERRRQKGLLQ